MRDQKVTAYSVYWNATLYFSYQKKPFPVIRQRGMKLFRFGAEPENFPGDSYLRTRIALTTITKRWMWSPGLCSWIQNEIKESQYRPQMQQQQRFRRPMLRKFENVHTSINAIHSFQLRHRYSPLNPQGKHYRKHLFLRTGYQLLPRSKCSCCPPTC